MAEVAVSHRRVADHTGLLGSGGLIGDQRIGKSVLCPRHDSTAIQRGVVEANLLEGNLRSSRGDD